MKEQLISKKILNWYDLNKRSLPWRKNVSFQKRQYYTLVSEFMLQQTQVVTVIPYFNKFIKKIPNLEILAKVQNKKLIKLWEGLGYYSRARNLKKTAKVVIKNFKGKLQIIDNKLEELMSTSDYISIHCLANKETTNLIDDAMFKVCKPNLVIVNTARGVIIDLNAAYEALKSEKIRAIGLDVLPTEPADNNHPLIKAWLNEKWAEGRIVLTPHSAFYSPTGLVFLREKALKTCIDHIEGVNTVNCINTKFLKKF